jgi:FkbM family methyltransferase
MISERLEPLSNWLGRLPSFRGKSRFVNLLGSVISWGGSGFTVCSPYPGTRLKVNLGDRIERLMWGGCYELHIRRCLQALLRPGDVFLDVGAHIGFHSVLGASLVGPLGRVYAFEADPMVYERLQENVSAFPWVRAVDQAVWKHGGKLSFERASDAGESGWGTLTLVRSLGKGQIIDVAATSLDEWMEVNSVRQLRGIKMDAEGSEYAILKGASHLLDQLRPFLVLEMNDILLRQAGTSAAELAGELRRFDYMVFELRYPGMERLDAYNTPAASEVLAIHRAGMDTDVASLRAAGFRL